MAPWPALLTMKTCYSSLQIRMEDPILSRPASIAGLLAHAAQVRKPLVAPSALRVSTDWRQRTQRVLAALESPDARDRMGRSAAAAAAATASAPAAGLGFGSGAAGTGVTAVRVRRRSRAGPDAGAGGMDAPPPVSIPLVACRDPGELTLGAGSPSKAAARTTLGATFQATVAALSPSAVRGSSGLPGDRPLPGGYGIGFGDDEDVPVRGGGERWAGAGVEEKQVNWPCFSAPCRVLCGAAAHQHPPPMLPHINAEHVHHQ
jgi:hypothetical protein